MNQQKAFQDFLVTQSLQIPLAEFVISLLLTVLVSLILGRIYIRFGHSLSNRKLFANHLLLISMTTMLIISIVKASLALSLGLVGALSIVRFRAAIKEPEELAYLFIAIALGLGFGAHQRVITIVAFVILIGVIVIKGRLQKGDSNSNLYFEVASHNPRKLELKQVVDELNKHCKAVNLRRFNEKNELLEASFLVEYDDFKKLEMCKDALLKMGDDVHITFMDNKSLLV